jgi:hypothetical protein
VNFPTKFGLAISKKRERRHVPDGGFLATLVGLTSSQFIAGTRSEKELRDGINEWVENKVYFEAKKKIRQKLYPCPWTFEFVVHKLKFPQELDLI